MLWRFDMRFAPLLWTLLPFAIRSVAGDTVACSGGCVDNWDRCAGRGFTAPRPCCNDDFVCVQKNSFFAQCRPADIEPPSSWDGQVLTCEDAGNDCEDLTAVTVKWVQVAANSFTNFDFGRNLGSMQELDGCAEACADNDDCFAFSEYDFARGGERCELWGRDLISTEPFVNDVDNEPNLEPSLFTNISFIKCFDPPPLCDPAGEVRQVGVDTGPFFKYTEAGAGGFDRNRAESFYTTGDDSDTFEACITVCRLSQSPFDDPLNCIGFALDVEEVEGAQRTLCTLLYAERLGIVTEYLPTADSRIFTLDDCPTSTELAQM